LTWQLTLKRRKNSIPGFGTVKIVIAFSSNIFIENLRNKKRIKNWGRDIKSNISS
jgi:hypothetical protein